MSDIDLKQVLGMGVAAAGLVNPGTGVLLYSPNLPRLRDAPLKALLEQEIKAPVWLANDASLAALGEHRFGAGRGFSHLVYITVSTGIGGGVIIDNALFLGSQGFAAEIGHMVIDPDGPRCACGNIGCLEALASGSAIARMASEEMSKGKVSVITSLADNDLSGVTAEVVARAAQSGDPLASEIMERAGTSLGIGVVNLLHLFDPELIIIGGGVSRAGELILAPVRKVIAERAMPGFRQAKVVTSALGDDSGLYGAVALVLEKCSE
jgi:glucokinase